MGRNNLKNIKAHNDKLHKKEAKERTKAAERKAQLKAIMDAHNAQKKTDELG